MRCAKPRKRSGHSELASLADARANGFAYDPAGKAAPPAMPGLHSFGEWPLRDLKASIDWTPFFRAWELAGNYPAILDDPVVGESARNLFDDANAMLDKIMAERWLTASGTVGLWRCKRDGDDVLVLAGNDWVRVPFLRQQVKKREGRANMCLADFIDPEGEDWIGGFAVGIHGLEPHLAAVQGRAMTIIRKSCSRRCPTGLPKASPKCSMPRSATACGAMPTSICPMPS